MDVPIKAFEYYLQGFRLHSQTTQRANTLAQKMFARAIEEHPTYARAIGHLAYTQLNAWLSGWTAKPPNDLRKRVDKAVALDPNDYDNLWSRAGVYLYTAKLAPSGTKGRKASRAADRKAVIGMYEAATAKAEEQAIDYNLSGLRVDVADALFFTGATLADIDEAIAITKEAIDGVHPSHPKRFLWTLGWAYYERAHFSKKTEDYIASLEALLKIAFPTDNVIKNIIADYVALGWIKPAERLAHEFKCRNPKYRLASEDRWPYLDDDRLERWKGHLRGAGLPDR
jgi:tetratricopeptide (TPR) repeat protein